MGDLVDVGRLSRDLKTKMISDSDGKEYTLAELQFFELSEFPVAAQTRLEKEMAHLLAVFFEREDIQVASSLKLPDRYNRRAVHLYLAGKNPQWLQAELIRSGFALARTGSWGKVQVSCFDKLLDLEKLAEKKHAGIWQFGNLVVMPSNDRNWAAKTNAYRIVEGTVLSVGQAGSKYYLNFGENWQRDFTVIVAKRTAKRFKKTVGDITSLAGKKLRIRGWLISDRGPMIEVYHLDQIEFDRK
jgi:hypothetical protein